MSRTIRLLATYALAAVGLAGLVFLSACNITSSPAAGGTARLNVLMTDAPSDDWSVVQVTVTSVSLRNADTQAWVSVWNGSQTLNLVDFTGVNGFLTQNANIPAATYDRLKLTIDPTSFSLTDSNSTTYQPADITVVDPSGKGEIKVDIIPAVTLSSSTTDVASLGLDFDLAHPLSIIVQNGKVIINLQVRHKAIPRNLRDIQFARSLGHITAADPANPTTFTMHTLEGADLTFGVDLSTKYVDVDHTDQTANFAGLAALKDTSTDFSSLYGALVASNMNSNGTLYAREVWYGTITALPKFSPEGLVRRVGDNWIKVLNKNAENTDGGHMSCHWDSDIIYVNDKTVWTFHKDISMGTGTEVLKYIRRGFRVSVTLDPAAAPARLASAINVQSARDEGAIKSVSAAGFTFGGWGYHDGWNCGPGDWPHFSHEWLFSTVSGHLFSWWFYGMAPTTVADTTALAGVIKDFTDTVNQAKLANLRVFAWAELYWDTLNSQWVAENVVFAPEKLPDPTKITQNYAQADPADPKKGGSMVVSTFDWDDETLPTPMTVYLDSTGDLQTVVGSLIWNSTTRILTFTVPVPPENWQSLLTTGLLGVRVWVRPVKGSDGLFTWHAYTVMAFQLITN